MNISTQYITVLFLTLVAFTAHAQVNIELHALKELSSPAITIADVASIQDGDLLVRKRIAELDLAQLKARHGRTDRHETRGGA